MRKLIGYALVLAVMAAAPLYLAPYELSLLGRFLALAIVALGISLIWGTGGMLSLGQGVFFALGGYALAMHLKLANADAGALPDFMQWSGLTTLPWWWEPFRSPAVALAAVLVLPGLAAAWTGQDEAPELRAGPQGAEIVLMQFPADALTRYA